MKRTRFYEVTTTSADAKTHLVEASSESGALKHVASQFVGEPKIADAKRVAELMGQGVVPEKAAVSE